MRGTTPQQVALRGEQHRQAGHDQSGPTNPRAPGPVGAAGDATKSATGFRGLAGARQPAAHLPPGSQYRLSAGRRAPRLTWRARGLHNLPQRPLRSAPAARIGRWSTCGQPRSRAIGRTKHRSGITEALHWHRTPATRALIFPFLLFDLLVVFK